MYIFNKKKKLVDLPERERPEVRKEARGWGDAVEVPRTLVTKAFKVLMANNFIL